MTTLHWNVHRDAERKPDLAGSRAGSQCSVRGAIPKRRDHQITGEYPTVGSAEFLTDRLMELAQLHVSPLMQGAPRSATGAPLATIFGLPRH